MSQRKPRDEKDSNWTARDVARRQRELVDRQLAEMREGSPPRHFAVAAEVLEWLRDNRSVGIVTLLDAGCGSGYYAEIFDHCVPGFVEYTGLDFSAGMLEVAREYYPHIRFIVSDLRAMKAVEDRAYDVVLSGAALMHIRDWRQALDEMARAADRWLVLHRTWVHPDAEETAISVGDAYGRAVWYITFSEQELLALLAEMGWQLIHELPSGEVLNAGREVKTYLFEREDG
jgi:SAM-dependent methyltransferase